MLCSQTAQTTFSVLLWPLHSGHSPSWAHLSIRWSKSDPRVLREGDLVFLSSTPPTELRILAYHLQEAPTQNLGEGSGSNSSSTTTSCVALSKSLHSFRSHFPHTWHGNHSPYSKGLWRAWCKAPAPTVCARTGNFTFFVMKKYTGITDGQWL